MSRKRHTTRTLWTVVLFVLAGFPVWAAATLPGWPAVADSISPASTLLPGEPGLSDADVVWCLDEPERVARAAQFLDLETGLTANGQSVSVGETSLPVDQWGKESPTLYKRACIAASGAAFPPPAPTPVYLAILDEAGAVLFGAGITGVGFLLKRGIDRRDELTRDRQRRANELRGKARFIASAIERFMDLGPRGRDESPLRNQAVEAMNEVEGELQNEKRSHPEWTTVPRLDEVIRRIRDDPLKDMGSTTAKGSASHEQIRTFLKSLEAVTDELQRAEYGERAAVASLQSPI